jgi:protein tyrosine/serine phosphatase
MSDANTLLNRAKSALIAHDYALAARIYKNLIMEEPDNVDYKIQLGNLYTKAGKDDQALTIFQQINKNNSENLDVLIAISGIYRRQKKYEESVVIFVPQVLDYSRQALRDVTGVSNARRLGGYINTEGRKIKQNVLLRTANLSHITDGGINALKNKYKVSDIIDLRYDRELNAHTTDKDIEGVNHHSVPMSATKDTAGQVFSQHPELFEKMQELQKNAGKPGGSLKLSIFQAEVGVINVQKHIEYFESDEAVGYYRDVFNIILNKPEDADLRYNIIYTAAVYPEVMETNIDDLTKQYGSVKNFLREKVGLTDDDFAKLRKLYLED